MNLRYNNEINYEFLGKIVRRYRKAKGISQEKLAELCEISPSHMSHIENGTANVGIQTIVKLANILDTSMDELFEGNVDCSSRNVLDKEISMLIKDFDYHQRQLIIKIIKNIADYTNDSE